MCTLCRHSVPVDCYNAITAQIIARRMDRVCSVTEGTDPETDSLSQQD